MYFTANVLTNFIINHYFNESNCLLILTNRMTPFYYNGEIAYVSINIDGFQLPHHVIFNHYGCQAIIINSEYFTAIFEQLEAEMKLHPDRFNYRKYLFLPAMNQSKDILHVFESPAVKYVADILAVKLNSTKLGIFGSEECIFDLYTHKYRGFEKDLHNVIWLDRWYSANDSFLINTNLFPDKLKDQSGRILRIAAFTYKPYSLVNPPRGTDVLTISEYIKRHNMAPKYMTDEKSRFGDVYQNWTGYGISGSVALDRADIAVPAIIWVEYLYRFLDYSNYVRRSGITCIVKAPRLASGLAKPLLPFSKNIWLMTVTSYFFISFSVFLILTLSPEHGNRHSNIRERLLTSFGMSGKIFLLQSHQTRVKKSRLIFGMAWILGLFLTSAYCGGFASIIAIPSYYDTIRTVDDFIASKMKWGARSTTGTLFDLQPKLIDSYVIQDEEYLRKMNDDENFGYLIERLERGYFAIGDYVTLQGAEKRRILDEDIVWVYRLLILRKNSILLPSLNKVIDAVMESGLSKFWQGQVVTRYMDPKIQKAVHDSSFETKPNAVRRKLTLRHVEGIFAIWFVGLMISILAFLGEILTKKLTRV